MRLLFCGRPSFGHINNFPRLLIPSDSGVNIQGSSCGALAQLALRASQGLPVTH